MPKYRHEYFDFVQFIQFINQNLTKPLKMDKMLKWANINSSVLVLAPISKTQNPQAF